MDTQTLDQTRRATLKILSTAHTPLDLQKLSCQIHDVRFDFYLPPTAHDIIYKRLPREFLNISLSTQFRVNWYSPQDLIRVQNEEWAANPDSHCNILSDEQLKIVSQRDFLLRYNSETDLDLITPYDFEDGFFNFLRFFLPTELLRKNTIVFHSSCFITDNQEALLFLGPSGAGKTTLVSMSDPQFVLGDDMHLIKFENNRLYVRQAYFGQRIYNQKLLNKTFPVKNLFWLKKSDRNFVNPISNESQRLKILSSFAGLFWDSLTEAQNQKVFELFSALQNIELSELEFNLDKTIIDFLQRKFNQEQHA